MLEKMKGGLVVSCQALPHEPLHGSHHMAAMARAAKESGAVGIRANGYEDIREIKSKIDLPMIGILKFNDPSYDAFITATKEHAKLVSDAGADIIAVDATARSRPVPFPELVVYIKQTLGKLVMADVSTWEEGVEAERVGCDMVGTTLSGYTEATKHRTNPDFELIETLVNKLKVPVIAEGGIRTPEQAKRAMDLGAFFVVVGGAITRPQEITARFVEGIKR